MGVRWILFISLLLVAFASAQVGSSTEQRIYYGTTDTPYSGFGKLRTYAILDPTSSVASGGDWRPTELGIELSKGLIDMAEYAATNATYTLIEEGREFNYSDKTPFFAIDMEEIIRNALNLRAGNDGIVLLNGQEIGSGNIEFINSIVDTLVEPVIPESTSLRNVTMFLGRVPLFGELYLPFKSIMVNYFPVGHGPVNTSFELPHWHFGFMNLDVDTLVTELRPSECSETIDFDTNECDLLLASESDEALAPTSATGGGAAATGGSESAQPSQESNPEQSVDQNQGGAGGAAAGGEDTTTEVESPVNSTTTCSFEGPWVVSCLAARKSLQPVDLNFKPAGWRQFNWPAPLAGDILIDPQSPILTTTDADSGFFYQKYDGKLAGWSIDISQERMKSSMEGCQLITSPEQYYYSGWYPRQWCIDYDPLSETVRVLLRNFVFEMGAQ